MYLGSIQCYPLQSSAVGTVDVPWLPVQPYLHGSHSLQDLISFIPLVRCLWVYSLRTKFTSPQGTRSGH